MPHVGRKGEEMKKLLTATVVVAALFAMVVGGASAGSGNPSGTGQPSQSCGGQNATTMPGGGNSATSTGSPFQGASSAGVYANGPGTGGPGTATGTGHITNPNAVSQYDVACYQVTIHH
jgi:hypothetical protein